MSFASLRTELVESVRDILGATVDVIWEDEVSDWMDLSHVRLGVVSITTPNKPERRYTESGALDLEERVVTFPRINVQVTCESGSQRLEESAWETAYRLRLGLANEETQDTLGVAGIAIVEASPVTSAHYEDAHNRWRSAATFELGINTCMSFTSSELIGKVLSVEYTGNTGTVTVPE